MLRRCFEHSEYRKDDDFVLKEMNAGDNEELIYRSESL